jgi:hypothetical protein
MTCFISTPSNAGWMVKRKLNAQPVRRNEYDAKTPEKRWENGRPWLVRA